MTKCIYDLLMLTAHFSNRIYMGGRTHTARGEVLDQSDFDDCLRAPKLEADYAVSVDRLSYRPFAQRAKAPPATGTRPGPHIGRYQINGFVCVMRKANVIDSPLRSMCFRAVSFLRSEIAKFREVWIYNPGRHYMRGPGPKWREKHASLRIADMQSEPPMRLTARTRSFHRAENLSAFI